MQPLEVRAWLVLGSFMAAVQGCSSVRGDEQVCSGIGLLLNTSIAAAEAAAV